MKRMLAAVLVSAALLAGPGEKPCVALTFDDGPSGKITEKLLDGLYDRGVHASFLLCGYRMEQYPELTQRIYDEGHEIGCHGFTHSSMRPMSRRQVAAEITDTEELLPDGCRFAFLRPPGGAVSDGVRQVAKARGLSILSWSVDPRDWATRDVTAIEHRVLEHVKDGDVILLHDMTASSVQAALDIVDALLKQNFDIVTVGELAKRREVKMKPGETYTCFPRKDAP